VTAPITAAPAGSGEFGEKATTRDGSAATAAVEPSLILRAMRFVPSVPPTRVADVGVVVPVNPTERFEVEIVLLGEIATTRAGSVATAAVEAALTAAGPCVPSVTVVGHELAVVFGAPCATVALRFAAVV
jgi:hypothetical protein